MARIILIFLSILTVSVSALDRFWDARYTFGPEFMVKDRFTLGAGFYTEYQEDASFPLNIQIALSDYWEVGGKLFFTTYEKLESIYAYIDVGAKYRFQPNSTLQMDILMGLNHDNGGALSFTYNNLQVITKNFSTLYEARIGLFDGVAGSDGWVKFSGAVFPQVRLGNPIRATIGIVSSGSVGNLSDDFMIDLLPRLDIGILSYLTLTGELAIGVLQSKNNDKVRLAFYAACQI